LINKEKKETYSLISPKENAIMMAQAMRDKSAADIEILEVSPLSSVTDYFVICTGTSTIQMRTIADEVEKRTLENGGEILHIEGYDTAGWILVDAGVALAHIFHKEIREFYHLERLWSDAKRIDF